MSERPQKSPAFPETRWSLVVATRGDDTRALRAMDEFCRGYWYPVFAFARQTGLSPADAEDVTQGFFAMVLSKEMTSAVSPDAGKLRSYLIAALKNFIGNQHRRSRAKKRGGGLRIVSIDAEEAEGRYQSELSSGENPETAFVRRWAIALLDSALGRLEREYERRDNAATFVELVPLLVDCERGKSFKEAARALGVSEAAVRVAVFRLRKRYRALVREEVSETVADPAEIDGEINALFAALQR